MKARIIRSEEVKEVDHGATKTATLLETADFNLARIRKTGNEIKTGFDKESNVAYYVLEGEGECVIDGKKYRLKKGDCVFYPKGTTYKHLKGLTLLAIACPPFDRSKRVYVE
jgi:mannose-6-phosphate isomerase-like protein (cupin superfamily)